MSITITQTAAKHVNEHLMSRGTGIGLRLGVKQDAKMSKAILILIVVAVVIAFGYFVSNRKD